MTQVRYLLPFLLLAGVAGVHAQPIVKINPGASECDVTPTGSEIFHLDTSGNVLITGTLGGSCGGGTSGTPAVTFNPISPAPFPLTLSTNSINAGTGTGSSANVSYSAAYATSCNVTASAGTASPSGSGSCPALTISNASCGASGSTCSGNGTVTEPTALSGPTSCNYTLTASCSPSGTGSTSTAALSVVTSGGGGGGSNASCPNLQPIGTGTANQFWSKVSSTSVKYGDGTVKSGVDATSYTDVWSYPGTTVAWPGNVGLTTRPSASVNQYFSEKFVVPNDGSVTRASWAWSGSGINSNFAMTISACPGDFGQSGTILTAGCKVNQSGSASGLTILVNAAQQGTACTLVPGNTYYLNLLPMAPLPVNNVSTTTCSGTCTPWAGITGVN